MKYAAGVDVGSTYTKAVILDDDGQIAGKAMARSGFKLTEAAAAESASCIVVGHRRSARGVSRLDSTAYGLVNHADRPVLVVPAT